MKKTASQIADQVLEKVGKKVRLENPYTGETEMVERPAEIRDSPSWSIPIGLLLGSLGGGVLGSRLGMRHGGPGLSTLGMVGGGLGGAALGAGTGTKIDELIHRNDPNRLALQKWLREEYDKRGWE